MPIYEPDIVVTGQSSGYHRALDRAVENLNAAISRHPDYVVIDHKLTVSRNEEDFPMLVLTAVLRSVRTARLIKQLDLTNDFVPLSHERTHESGPGRIGA